MWETTEFREALPGSHFLVYKFNCTSCNSCNVGETFSHNWIENSVTDFVSGRFELKKDRAQIVCEYISLQEDDDLFPADGRAALEELTEDDMENEVYFIKEH